MSLKSFHIFFIIISLITGVFLAGWGFHEYSTSANQGSLVFGCLGLMLAMALVPYGLWFRKKMKTLLAITPMVALLWPSWAWSCAVCFGDPKSLLTLSAKWGVVVLLGFIGGVLGSIAVIGWTWARRARKIES